MNMKETHLAVTLSATYCTLNTLTDKTKKIWIAFHGYGMLSRYFIKKFELLNPEENFIIAPQGLSRFYLEGFTGRVGACWMTKEDRLTEIDNQLKYIDAVLQKEISENHHAEVILFGFSQGTATAVRYGAFSNLKFNKLVLWSGTFPDDLTSAQVTHWPNDLKILYFSGKYDPFLQPGMQQRIFDLVKNITGKHLEFHEFEGKHEVIQELLYLI